MSFPTIQNLISDLNRKVSPGNTSQSKDIFGAIGEGGRRMLEVIRPKELSRRVLIENALYDQVNQFGCPDDLDEKKIMQWYRLKGNRSTDSYYHPMHQVTNRAFDQNSNYDRCNRQEFTIEWQSGVKFIKVKDFTGHTGTTLSQMNAVNEDGLWNTFGNVTNLTTDNLTYVAGHGSLRFDINTSSNTGGIINFQQTAQDITSYFNVGKVFTWLDLPNLNQIQTVTLDILTNASNLATDYYSITVNSPHDSPTFQLGQNLLGFPLDSYSMNTIGTPNPANVIGLRFTFVTNGTLLMRSVRIDNVVARKGTVFGIQYLSQYLYEDIGTGLWKQNPTAVTDIIHIAPATYNLMLDDCAVVTAQEIFSGAEGAKDLAGLEAKRAEDYTTYMRNNKAEYIDEQQEPYRWGVDFGYRGRWGSENRYDHSQDHI